MGLDRYRQKRNFRITPEPEGRVETGAKDQLGFVIQKHAATRLHYDFRLELDGVLLSWAVPKGPSLDPNDKRLAMHVEDHPIEYGEFEGVIPPKQYGAGTVMLWDRGIWVPKTDPREGYRKGRLKFELRGKKLQGGWNLVRSSGGKYGGEKSWLLFKEADEHARLDQAALIVDDMPDSVATGRSLQQIASSADRVWHSNKSVAANLKGGAIAKAKPVTGIAKLSGARKAPQPEAVEAQLATLSKTPPVGNGWIHEIKYDGYRMLCRVAQGHVRIVSRNQKDWTANFPELAVELSRLPLKTAWLDGEVAAMDAQGRSSFQALQNALSASPAANVCYFAFDLLYLDGFDLRSMALTERKRVLQALLPGASGIVRYSDHFSAPAAAFLDNVCKLGLEGMISKRGDRPYQAGRTPAWVKVKCERRQEMVIAGFTDPGGSRQGFGALLLGVYDGQGRLRYCGRVGTGFDDASLSRLSRTVRALEQPSSAFHDPPRGADARGVHWLQPKLVADVAFTEWTADGTLRHPSFRGLRDDKPATDVIREIPTGNDAAAPAAHEEPASAPERATAAPRGPRGSVAGVALSNADKVLFPEAGYTKLALAKYYESAAEWILPHLRARPLTLLRCPNGWDKPCFYQKKADASAIPAIERVQIAASDGSRADYMMANSLQAVVGLLQMGTLELHPWGSSVGQLELPDRLTFDLDPDEKVTWSELTEAARVVKTLLENIGLQPFLKTTGGKGLHVVVALEPSAGWEDAKGFTRAAAQFLERTFPDRFTSNLLKVSRHRKIFIDYLRNAEGSTAVAAYSIRAKAHAPVSTPIDWRELSRDVRFAYFNVGSVRKRLAKLKRDPWAGIGESARPLDKSMMEKVGYRPR